MKPHARRPLLLVLLLFRAGVATAAAGAVSPQGSRQISATTTTAATTTTDGGDHDFLGRRGLRKHANTDAANPPLLHALAHNTSSNSFPLSSDVVCPQQQEQDRAMIRITFDFWYAVGSLAPVPDVSGEIENVLLDQAKDEILSGWCHHHEGGGGGNDGGLRRRRSRKLQQRQQQSNRATTTTTTSNHRSSSMIAINAGPSDIIRTEFACPEKLSSWIEITGAVTCQVIQGQMQVLVLDIDHDLNPLITAIRQALHRAMWTRFNKENNDNGNGNILFVAYLGDSRDQALAAGGGGEYYLWGWGPFDDSIHHLDDNNATTTTTVTIEPKKNSSDIGGDNGDFVAPISFAPTDDGKNHSRRATKILLGFLVPLLVLVVCLCACFTCSAEETTTPADHDPMKGSSTLTTTCPPCMAGGSSTTTAGDSSSKGDASGYHQGLFHYSCEGKRYLSTKCEKCIATLEAIRKNQEQEEQEKQRRQQEEQRQKQQAAADANHNKEERINSSPRRIITTRILTGSNNNTNNNNDKNHKSRNNKNQKGDAASTTDDDEDSSDETVTTTTTTTTSYEGDSSAMNHTSSFTLPDLMRPGSKHSSIDVHYCNSANCTCANKSQQTTFVPSWALPSNRSSATPVASWLTDDQHLGA